MFRLIKSNETFVAFDTETTGLSPDTNRVIEIGAVKFNSNGILGSYNNLVNPNQPIPPEITALTSITERMIQNERKIFQILPEFLDFIKDSIIIGHNIQFDIRFLNAECLRNGFPPIKNDAIDTLMFSRWAFPELKRYKQTYMAEYLNLDIKEAHRAYDDAFVCGNLFLHLIKATADRQKI
ncbi:MAG: 3'-5' exonuclease [Treponema sp.]|nr:3'-5' exonuclease [Treponema sp.]